jgi:two-component system, OmpR family, response regulator
MIIINPAETRTREHISPRLLDCPDSWRTRRHMEDPQATPQNGNATDVLDVLVVEDDPEINELVAAYVQLAGFPCRRVMRGDDALREIAARRPALIVLDVMLPDLDGFEICRRLRADRRTASVPVIILTALDEDHCRSRSADCGPYEYMTKPFDPDALLSAIHRAISSTGTPTPAARRD